MIVFNFPDKCPSCSSENIIPAMVEADQDVPKGQQPFLCKDCDVLWSEALITSRDWACMIGIMEAAWMLPKGILVNPQGTDPKATARDLLGIPEKANHVIASLQKVLDDGNEQADFTRKGVKKLWRPH